MVMCERFMVIYGFLLHYRLSWGLLYAVLVTIMSFLMSIIATHTALFPNSDFFVIFILIFLYGISSVSRTGVKTESSYCKKNNFQVISIETPKWLGRNVILAFFHSVLSRSTDLFLLHADTVIQEAQVCQHGGLHADGGVWLPVALHGADEGLPTAAGLAFVSALPERLLHWDCSGNKGTVAKIQITSSSSSSGVEIIIIFMNICFFLLLFHLKS